MTRNECVRRVLEIVANGQQVLADGDAADLPSMVAAANAIDILCALPLDSVMPHVCPTVDDGVIVLDWRDGDEFLEVIWAHPDGRFLVLTDSTKTVGMDEAIEFARKAAVRKVEA